MSGIELPDGQYIRVEHCAIDPEQIGTIGVHRLVSIPRGQIHHLLIGPYPHLSLIKAFAPEATKAEILGDGGGHFRVVNTTLVGEGKSHDYEELRPDFREPILELVRQELIARNILVDAVEENFHD